MKGGLFRHQQPKGLVSATARPSHHRATPRLYKGVFFRNQSMNANAPPVTAVISSSPISKGSGKGSRIMHIIVSCPHYAADSPRNPQHPYLIAGRSRSIKESRNQIKDGVASGQKPNTRLHQLAEGATCSRCSGFSKQRVGGKVGWSVLPGVTQVPFPGRTIKTRACLPKLPLLQRAAR
jgi:hypothetical protein